MVQARASEPAHDLDAVRETARRLLENVERVVVGKHEEIALVLSALISGGHVLLEDVPGTAKTMLARSLAHTIEGAVGGKASADYLWSYLASHPAGKKQLQVVHSTGALQAVQGAPLKTTAAAENTFWPPLDALIDTATG